MEGGREEGGRLGREGGRERGRKGGREGGWRTTGVGRGKVLGQTETKAVSEL
jgi:hypothetical protein